MAERGTEWMDARLLPPTHVSSLRVATSPVECVVASRPYPLKGRRAACWSCALKKDAVDELLTVVALAAGWNTKTRATRGDSGARRGGAAWKDAVLVVVADDEREEEDACISDSRAPKKMRARNEARHV